MAKWEYSVLESSGGNITAVNDTTVRHEKIPEIAHLKKWGEDGWELVSVTVNPISIYRFFFKRSGT